MMKILALSFALVLGQSEKVSLDAIWPQWRGPTGDSVSPSKKLPTHWSKKDNVVWATPIPGWGNSTPAIWNEAIYVTTQVDDRDLVLLRLDRGTGKVVWRKDVGQGSPKRKGPVGNLRFHDEHNMATPSPVTDGQHVWVTFGNGDIACYTAAGEKVWSKSLLDEYGPLSIWWGHGNSPIVYKDLLITNVIQDPAGKGPSYVVAHEKLTGKKRWFVERVTGAKGEPADSYTTPLLWNKNGKMELIIFGGNVLDSYDPDTGDRLWWYGGFKGNRVISGPTLVGDTVFAVEGMKGPVYAVKAGGKADVSASNLVWKTKSKGSNPDASTPVVTNGLVFMANNDGVAMCLDAATGEEQWKERLGSPMRASPLASGDRVYFFGKDGKATIVAASRSYTLIAQPELGEEIIASPAVAGNDLYVRTKNHLYRIGEK
jgi:outer membrane protein assembly factor BamB